MRNLSESEVIRLLGISKNTLKRWRAKKKIKFHKLGENTAPIIYEPEVVEKKRLERIEELESEIESIRMSVYDYLELDNP